MRRMFMASALFGALWLGPTVASADTGFVISLSYGKGFVTAPDFGASPSTIMLSPGVSLLDLLRVELGLVAGLPDLENSQFDVELRPSLVLAPPILPVYGRIIVGVTNLVDDLPTEITWGGGIGGQFGLGPLGIFGEIDVLPTGNPDFVLIEARIGIGYFG